MKFTLKDYQEDAVRDALANLAKARRLWHHEADKTAFSLTAVTGAGKTVMAAAAFEALFRGSDDLNFDADPGAVVLWLSDDPSLNDQTRFRLMESSDRIHYGDMVVVENTFNQPRFQAGKIYFLNTQKLSKNSLLVRGHDPEELQAKGGDLLPETRPDLRAFTIWDTIQNTIEDPELTLYLVLDEAHRGMGKQTAAAENSKSTIVQRLINGSGGVPGIPVVWGISATVERFNQAIASAGKHIRLPNVVVDAAKVQESGLIKDTILLDIPDEAGDFDTVLVRRGTDKLKESTFAWAEYAKQQDEARRVIPLMVLQVPNTPDPNEIGRALDTIFERYPELPTASIAHVFGDHTTQRFGNRDVPYIEPQRVQESIWVRVLIAKDAISTGWDCPRAEVMVSFRSASDETHITQLLGRMVRSPLARRIPGNDRLNSVDCLLPKFNRKTVEKVVDVLMKGDESGPPTGRILIDYVEVKPNPDATVAVWQLFESLPSQTRPQRGAKPAKRLTALAHELACDGILAGAGRLAHGKLHAALDAFATSHLDKIEAKRKAARTYVEHLAQKTASIDDDPEEYLEAITEARVTIAGMGLVSEIEAYFDAKADELAKTFLETYSPQIKALSDNRKETYRQIIEMSTDPQSVDLAKPESRYEATKAVESGTASAFPTWKKHLLCDKDGKYPAELNEWERAVVEAECKRPGFLFWYRNPQQPGQSSLGVAYKEDDEYKIVRPDFIFFSEQDGKVVADIVDPHGIHLADALPKLRGMAEYAQTHAAAYRRMVAVAEVNGKLRALNLTDVATQQAILQTRDAKTLYKEATASDYPE
jgi:hypothetical protein